MSREFSGHWFIQAQGGAGYTVGEAAFGSLISPSASLGFGYRFTPVWSLRAVMGGWQAKGALVAPSEIYRFSYLQGNVDVMADICSMFSGYRISRAVSPYLFAGLGLNGAFGNSGANALAARFPADSYLWKGKELFPAGRFGAGTGIRITDAVQFNVELGANILSDRFNSKKGSAVDWQINVQAGLTFNIGMKRSRRKTPVPGSYAAPAPHPAPAPAESYSPEQEETRSEPVRQETVSASPAFEEVRENVFFTIGRYDITAAEMPKVAAVVQVMTSNPETSVVVTGYADPQTGSAKRNLFLSRKRAEAVCDALKSAGIDQDRITVLYRGSSESPYSTPQENRVAVCVVTE